MCVCARARVLWPQEAAASDEAKKKEEDAAAAKKEEDAAAAKKKEEGEAAAVKAKEEEAAAAKAKEEETEEAAQHERVQRNEEVNQWNDKAAATPRKPATTGRGNAVKRKARQAVAEVTQPRPQRPRKAPEILRY